MPISAALAALAAVLLAACASGPLRIPESVPVASAAVVRTWSPGDVRVEAIDGVEVGGASHAYVAPGEHRITARWSGGQNVTRLGQVHGRLQSRSTYVIEAQPDAALRTVRFGIVDKGPNYNEECLKPSFFGGEPKGRGC